MEKRKALGRGLGALIPVSAPAKVSPPPLPEPEEERDPTPTAEHAEAPRGAAPPLAEEPAASPVVVAPPPPAASKGPREYFLCPIEEISPSSDNPRQVFNEQRLQELAESIKTQGLVQPLVVRLRSKEESPSEGEAPSFVLIAGERRWRAAQRAGLRDVPVVVKDVSAARAFELALVENLQREDLNAIEEAEGYRRLSDEFGYTQEELAQRVGRDRTTVSNSLRLLKLPGPVQRMVTESALTAGHARALLGLEVDDHMERLARRIADKQLSVRQTEALVRRERQEAEQSAKKPPKDKGKTPAVRDLEEELQKILGTRVRLITKDDAAGRIEIDFHSLDELDRLLALFRSASPA